MREYKRFPIKGIPNMRDLGGWPAKGGITRYGVFLRSALPSSVSQEDMALLREQGLKTVVDFRSEAECLRTPDALADTEGIEYIRLSMFDAAAAGGALRIMPEANFSWSGHYIRMAEEKKPRMAKVIFVCSRRSYITRRTRSKPLCPARRETMTQRGALGSPPRPQISRSSALSSALPALF